MPVRFFIHNRYARRHSPYKDAIAEKKEMVEISAKNKFTSDQSRPQLGDQWEPYTHLEGQLYFQSERFYTNVYLYDASSFADIETARQLINAELGKHSDAPQDINIALEVYFADDGDKIMCYYICDMATKEVFWLSNCPIHFLVEDGSFLVFNKEHLQHAQSLAYWHHIHMFPHSRVYSFAQLVELRMKGSYHLFDKKSSRSSSALNNAENLHRFRQIRPEAVAIDPETGGVSEYDMVKIARIHIIISVELLRHYHGTKWVTLGWNRSVNTSRDGLTSVHANCAPSPSWWFAISSWLFFYYPALYIRRLRQLWVDYEFQDHIWEGLITDVQEDWSASITPSTVILATNVGFLAIQSVDSPGGPGVATSERSGGQIISYISTLLSIGNILACAILSWQHRGMSHLSADYVASYCHIEYAAKPWRTEILAIVLSIPIVFFIWGMITFCAAVLWVSLHGTTTRTRLEVGVIGLVTVALLGLSIVHGWTRWTQTDVTLRSLQRSMKHYLHEIPVELTAQSRKLSLPLRRRPSMPSNTPPSMALDRTASRSEPGRSLATLTGETAV